ncbi:GntR family transcriptional regulator [Gluconobacter oxydans]|uniref:aminotransferase-like domain-containing protein n=1 Tax=Gluconobacter thailandicus TaxID=257438 RepID=UPI000301DE2B|nr:PLP-dependent aminotransferase family protein [Gluconobacter thailandicus]ANQ41806.1 GntR family transcriptional regulator [Gluconobacter oxydans]
MEKHELLQSWQETVRQSTGPLYKGIVQALALSVQQGVLHEGDRLPTQRLIASSLGTNLTTVTRAFREAHQIGLVDATVGRGTFVRVGAATSQWQATKASIVDMTMNLPPVPSVPSLATLMQTDFQNLFKSQSINSLMSYRVTGGTYDERYQGAKWIEPLIGPRRPDDIVVTPGAQTALAAAISVLTSPGDTILTEKMTYPGLRTVANQLGVLLVGVDGDEQGFLPLALEEACHKYRPKAIYCTPTIQNPTTITLPLTRRQSLMKIAHNAGIYVIEDDPYSLLLDNPIPALSALERGGVIYIATLAKVLSPGLRTAYVALPNPEFHQRFVAAVRAFSLTNAGVLSALTLRWMQSGQAENILAAIKSELRLRQSIAKAILGDRPGMDPNGPHIWLHLPPWWNSSDFVAYAHHRGLALVPSSVFSVSDFSPENVRVSLGNIPNINDLEKAMKDILTLLQYKKKDSYTPVV